MNATSKTDEFLRRYELHPDCVDRDAFTASYIAEMRAGLAGEGASLYMLPSYLSAEGRTREGTAVAVDIGGTNLKIAAVSFVNGRADMSKPDVSSVPGLSEELSKDAFFTAIAKRVLPYATDADRIGICFSHAAEILPDLDGCLISFSKEIRVSNAKGVMIARELSEKLTELGVREKKAYTLLNDTAAVLLGGAAQMPANAHDGFIGLVLGTGLNLSYVEKSAEIRKLGAAYETETMIVNTETGNFSAMPLGVVDRAFDDRTADPGSHRLEKMTSGRYLGDLILFSLKRAAEEGLLSEASVLAVSAMDELGTPDAGGFLAGKQGGRLDGVCSTEDDRAVVKAVADRLFERAARLAALAVLAVVEKTGVGLESSRPAVIVTEGSTINRLYSMKERFSRNVRDNARQRHFQILSPDNATLIGTALAAFHKQLR